MVNAQIYLFLKEENFQIRKEVLASLQNFMENRLQLDDRIKESFTSFKKFTASEDEIGDVHMSLARDVDLRELANQYDDIKESKIVKKPKAFPK